MTGGMTKRALFAPALALWLALEFFAFVAVAQTIGLGGALLAGFLTSLAGFALLRQSSGETLGLMRRAWAGEPPRDGALAEGLIGALGALLLILPGFLSDLVGLAFAAPSLRQWAARRVMDGKIFVRRRAAAPGVIDLNPGEWRAVDSPAEGVRR